MAPVHPPFFSQNLLSWYRQHKRDLPWRNSDNPYHIWLSEIILQQTQVAQGLAYYQRFIKGFPTVHHLARASEDVVLRMWQGLGYYSRARNLHLTAKFISHELSGVFPRTYAELLKLKGVGDYTAAAIASFAFGLPHAVVDGNVYRVLSRVFGIEAPIDANEGKKIFKSLADELLDRKRPGEYNQAIMEFGARHCRPRNPECSTCPFSEQCIAFRTDSVQKLPVKAKTIKTRERHFNYLVIADSRGRILLDKRKGGDIWEGLYQFKLIESNKALKAEKVMKMAQSLQFMDKSFELRLVSGPYSHVLTHQKLHTQFLVVSGPGKFKNSSLSASVSELDKYPLPRLIGKFLAEVDLKEIL